MVCADKYERIEPRGRCHVRTSMTETLDLRFLCPPLTAIHCVSCCKPMVTGGLGCGSCSKTLSRNSLGTIYVAPSAPTSAVNNNANVGGHCFYLNTQYVKCTSCHGPTIQGIRCPSCNHSHASTANIYLALFSPTPVSSHSIDGGFGSRGIPA